MLLLVASFVFFALHAVHLTADFPNHSPWMDWAKYTDEGWYGDAAIRHFQRGSWYVPGDFNPAAALPVWPILELAVFYFTGVTLAAARGLTVALFGLILLASYFLLRRWQTSPSSLAPAAATLLLAVSPFCYAFTRMAVLEPLLILLTLLALLVASMPLSSKSRFRRFLPALALGVLLPLTILTKTTAIFLFPAIAWLLWATSGYRGRTFFRVALQAAGIAAFFWGSYFVLFVRPHFLADYRYLFSANAYTGITLATMGTVVQDTFWDGLWIGTVLYPLALAASIVAVAVLRRKTSPLLVALMLWSAGYAAFLAYHNNLQPRYYLVLAVPLTLLTTLSLSGIIARLPTRIPSLRPILKTATALALAVIVVPDALQTLSYVRHPEYTFTAAADGVRKIIAANPSQNPLVLSISGSDLSLMTGLPSICDDFGTMELADRVAAYHPGWYAAWNQVDDDKMDALTPMFRLQRVAAFPAFDDPERNLLILYRLDPAVSAATRRSKRKPIPRLLQTKIGQQPSELQLKH